MVVIGRLHVVVGTLSVVAVIVKGGVWILGSTIWLQHPGRMERGGKKGSKSTVSTHPKYSQARIYTTYASVSMKWDVSVDWTAECQNKRGIASPIKDYASGNLHLEAVEESRW